MITTILELLTPEKLEKMLDDADLDEVIVNTSHRSDVEAVRQSIKDHNWILDVALDGERTREILVTDEFKLEVFKSYKRKYKQVIIDGKTHYLGWFSNRFYRYFEFFIGLSELDGCFDIENFKGVGWYFIFDDVRKTKTYVVGQLQSGIIEGFGMRSTWRRVLGNKDVLLICCQGISGK